MSAEHQKEMNVLTACEEGDAEAVHRLLADGASLEAQDNVQDSSLNDLTIFQKHRTPLHIACENNHLQVVTLLLEMGANIGGVTVSQLTLRVWIVKEYRKRPRTPLLSACFKGHTKVVKLLLDAGAKDKARLRLRWESELTQECLHLACRGGHVEVVTLLLEAGADIEQQDKVLISQYELVSVIFRERELPSTRPVKEAMWTWWLYFSMPVQSLKLTLGSASSIFISQFSSEGW
jgi:ankyrin repeat protein